MSPVGDNKVNLHFMFCHTRKVIVLISIRNIQPRVNTPHYNSRANSITPQKLLQCIRDTKLQSLTTLHFGPDLVHRPLDEFPTLGQFQVKLKTLIFEGESVGPGQFQETWMNCLEKLQLPKMSCYEFPRKMFFIKRFAATNPKNSNDSAISLPTLSVAYPSPTSISR